MASAERRVVKCSALRAGRIVPPARERSHVILVRHVVYIKRKSVVVSAVDVVDVAGVCRFVFLCINVGVWGRAPLGLFGPGSRRGCVGTGALKDIPALSRGAGALSSRHERKRLCVAEAVRYFPCGITWKCLDM